MEKQTAALLAYVQAMVQNSKTDPAALDAVDGELRPLADALRSLSRDIGEMQGYAAALAAGDLAFVPRAQNALLMPMKTLHASINHLAWQAREVSKGNFDQSGFFLPELSDAFEAVIEELKRRDEALHREIVASGEKERAAREGTRLFMNMIQSISLGITIVDTQTHRILFSNEKANELLYAVSAECYDCPDDGSFSKTIAEYQGEEASRAWELTCARASRYYHINSHRIFWEGRPAYAHVIEDVSQQLLHTSALAKQAYRDELTHLYNRRYCLEQLADLLAGDGFFSICYFDVDNLKYVNDVFGHVEGDEYLKLISETVKRSIRSEDIFGRVGGDEFIVLFRSTPAFIAESKFSAISQTVRDYSHVVKPYDASISYGVLEIKGGDGMDVEELLRLVDEKMYEYKRANKPKPAGPSVR